MDGNCNDHQQIPCYTDILAPPSCNLVGGQDYAHDVRLSLEVSQYNDKSKYCVLFGGASRFFHQQCLIVERLNEKSCRQINQQNSMYWLHSIQKTSLFPFPEPEVSAPIKPSPFCFFILQLGSMYKDTPTSLQISLKTRH